MTRTRHVGTPADLSDAVDEYRADGYALKRQGTRSARLARRDHGGIGGHLLVFVFLGWWVWISIFRLSVPTVPVIELDVFLALATVTALAGGAFEAGEPR